MTLRSTTSRVLRGGAAALTAAALSLAGVSAVHADAGPDVSSWQGGNINWNAVRDAGNQFAIIKATEGLDYVNPFFVQSSIGVKAAGMFRGTYHYADVRQPAAAQATKYALLTLGNGLPGDLPPVIDFEESKGLGRQDLINWLHEFLNTAQAITGKQPMIYTYPNFWRTAMGNTTEFNMYPLWIADYNGGQGPSLPLPGGWGSWAFWQYTASANIPGIGGGVDRNFYGGVAGPLVNMTNGFPNIPGLALAAAGSPTGSADAQAGLQTWGGAVPAGSVG